MVLAVARLSHRYGKKTALDDVSFSLESGVYGLLGPNGAGKTTLMSIIVGNLRPMSGTVSWDGVEVSRIGKDYRSVIGYVPQVQSLYPGFTAQRFLHYMAALKGLGTKDARLEVEEALDAVGLTDVAGHRVKTFSGGMRQRLLVAQALLGSPKLLVMDEPTAGLDPYQRDSVRKIIAEVASTQTVLVSTHVVSDVEWVSKEILLLKEGRLLRMAGRDALVDEMAAVTDAPDGRPLGLEDVYLHFYGEHGVEGSPLRA